MTKRTEAEDKWQSLATAAAIAGARKIVAINGGSFPATTLLSKLSDQQYGWIVTAAIFAWIKTRCEQAISENLDQEKAVRETGLVPSPCDVAAVTSILPTLADKAAIDWARPLQVWSKGEMTNFLLLAMGLIVKAECARDSGKILRQQNWDQQGEPLPL